VRAAPAVDRPRGAILVIQKSEPQWSQDILKVVDRQVHRLKMLTVRCTVAPPSNSAPHSGACRSLRLAME
jgi:hypothetical protein